VSNQWLDRIQGILLQQGDSSKRPTNSSDGVYFDGTTFLTNNYLTSIDPVGSPIYTVLIVMKRDTGGPDPDSMIAWNSQYTIAGDGLKFVGKTNFTHQLAGTPVKFTYTNIVSVPIDLLIAGTNFQGDEYLYTNGISTGSQGYQLGNDNTHYIWVGAASSSGTPVSHYKGWLRDFVVFTNSPFTALNISNSHYWVLSTYPDITP